MKKNKKKLKNKKHYAWLLLLLPAIIGFYIAQAGTTSTFDFTNFAWIGNNLQSNQANKMVELGDPVIGMISTKGDKYKVSMNGNEEQKILSGYAWLGIGQQDDKHKNFSDQNDLPTLGWIGFNQGVPKDSCFGMGDCYPVKWNKKPGGIAPEGYLSGWAKLFLGKDGSQNDYPETWVHFRSPGNISYECDSQNNYFVCSDKNGKMSGYAWSAGAESVYVEDNPGLGWIKFSEIVLSPSNCDPYSDTNCCGKDGVCNTLCPLGVDPDCGVTPASNAYCTIVFSDGGSADKETSKNICSSQANINMEAYISGMSLAAGDQLEWSCGKGDSPFVSPNKVNCEFTQTGNYYPTLRILNENGQEKIKCNTNNTKVSLSEAKACDVKVRLLGSADPYEKAIKISTEDQVETIITRNCLENGSISWETEGIKKKDDGEKAIFQFQKSGSKDIKASISGTECSPASVDVKEKVRWR